MTDTQWNLALPLHIGPYAGRDLSLSLVPQQHADRESLECFVRECFATVHQADIRHFMPTLLALRDSQGTFCAAAGVRTADSGALFLEQYLQQPVERVVSRLAGGPVERQQIVEVGNLAARSGGSARLIIVVMTWLLAHRKLDWVVFTGAASLINSFQRLGLNPLLLGDADPQRLGSEQHSWGSYYAGRPQVFAGSIRAGLAHLQVSGMAARLGLPAFDLEHSHAA